VNPNILLYENDKVMSDSDIKYDVVFFGLKSDSPQARDSFIQKLASTHNMPVDKFMFLRDKVNVVLYSNLTGSIAEKTASWLEMIGAVVRIEHHGQEKKQKLAFRKCPNCGGFNKIEAVRCAMCSYDFRQLSPSSSSQPASIQKKPSTGSIPIVSSNQLVRPFGRPDNYEAPKGAQINPAGIDLDVFSSEPKPEELKEPTMPIDLKSGTINPNTMPKNFEPASSSAPPKKNEK
jgi:hypothetical protein